MYNNPEEAIEFCRIHMDDQQYRKAYQRLGYVRSDLQEVDLSKVAKQSKNFMRELDQADRQYYLQRKFEALVLRRQKIIHLVNQEYVSLTKISSNLSALTERTQSKHPIIDKLKEDQSVFFDKQSKYYDRVTSIRLKKFHQAQQVQENSYLNSEHYKTLRDKNSSLSLSDRRSIKTYTDRSRSISATDSKRKKVYEQAQMRKNFEQQLKKRNFIDKDKKAREKVERVYRNLRIVTMERKYRSQVENQIVQTNKQTVKKSILEDIYKKKARTQRQIVKFSQNREQRLQQRDHKLQSQKNVYMQRQKSVEEYLSNVVRKNRDAFGQQLQRQLQHAERNKKRLDDQRKFELKQAAQFHQQREIQANMTKETLQFEKAKRNHELFQAYKKNLHHAIQTRDKRVKSVKTKLLDQRIKDQIASQNQIILRRQEQFKKKGITQRLYEKNKTVQEIQRIKNKLIGDRRVFFGHTLKKLRILDRQLGEKLGKIEPRSLTKSRFDNSIDKYERTTASKVIAQ